MLLVEAVCNYMTEILNNHEIAHRQEAKKFVFQVYGENIELIDSLSAENKNNLINKLLYDYRFKVNENKKNLEKINFWKKIVITVLIAIIGVPLFLMLVNFSFDKTLNSYSKMEQNFQKVFKGQKLK